MRVAFLSNFTVDLLARHFQSYLDVEVFVSGFDQFRLEIFNPESDYYTASPDFTVLFLDWEEFLLGRTLGDVKAEILNLYSFSSEHVNSYFIINNSFLMPTMDSVQAYNLIGNLKEVQAEINTFLAQQAYSNPNFFVLDLLSTLELHGANRIFDSTSWIFAKNKFSKFGIVEIARKLKNLINAIRDVQLKCLVVDLDNTLWGGVLGEDGTFGVRLGNDNLGNEYKNLQQTLNGIRKKGVILCICSKNNYEDVVDIFTTNPDMCLSLDDFVIKKINWERKDINLKEISSELGIAEEQIVFLDDDPFERALVKDNTAVIVPEFPSDVGELRLFMVRLDEDYFPKLYITAEDRIRTEMYQNNLVRNQHMATSVDFEQFIRSLEIRVEVKEARYSDLNRLAQLTQKTNQFNLNCIRFTVNDLNARLLSTNSSIYFAEVSDKFGDYGIVLLAILDFQNNTAILSTFLMSCRVIGRNIEKEFMKELINRLVNIDKIIAVHIPAPKNQMMAQKMMELGFEVESTFGNRTQFVRNLNNLYFEI